MRSAGNKIFIPFQNKKKYLTKKMFVFLIIMLKSALICDLSAVIKSALASTQLGPNRTLSQAPVIIRVSPGTAFWKKILIPVLSFSLIYPHLLITRYIIFTL